jgi:ParB-like chromosome segregation protein Spo0J
MARLNDLGKGKMEAPKLRPEIIKIKPGHNYRDMTSPDVRAHIDWLKGSIREIGVQEPIDVTFDDGVVYLEAGECRLTAAQELRKEGWDGYIPAFGVQGDEQKVFAKGLLDNGGLPPTKLEFGKAVDRLLGWGWTVEDVMPYVPAHVGVKGSKAKRYITEARDLHNAPVEVKNAVRNGVDGVKVSESLALAATRKGPTKAVETIREEVQKAKAKGEAVAKRPKGAGEATKKKTATAELTVKLLQLADILAEMILDDNVLLEDVQKKARQFQRLRKA